MFTREIVDVGGSRMPAEQAIAFTQSESAHRRQKGNRLKIKQEPRPGVDQV
jgi:hypothetical protein